MTLNTSLIPKPKSALVNGAPNLMEAPGGNGRRQNQKTLPVVTSWFNQARFGLFVHYGLYSLFEQGEWHLHHHGVPLDQYNGMAGSFRARQFDADALVGLAKRAGAGYVVLGARHHDGFCLWDTQTTRFNSLHTPAGRDLIREYVEACRRAELRVGLYYSVMSWQFPAIHAGPIKDPAGWEMMVAEVHEQMRELMSNYGRIDLLWYDGCVAPKIGADSIRAHYWRTDALNAMVRRLQPGILINDRSGSEGDFTTPEQHISPPPPGRLWEGCQTMNQSWGWNRADTHYKSTEELLRQMVSCARFGGNYLLNVGPLPDGAIPPEQVERLEAIGRWMERNGESIRGSERTPYTEAEHILGPVTMRGRRVYFHLTRWPEAPAWIAGIRVPIRGAHLLATGQELKVTQFPDGTVELKGLPEAGSVLLPAVIVLDLEQPLPRSRPPSLLVERDTGRFDPAEDKVHAISKWEWGVRQRLAFSAPTAGLYDVELGVIGRRRTRFRVMLDGKPWGKVLRLDCANYPGTVAIRGVVLDKGRHRLELVSVEAVSFGLYLWRLESRWSLVRADRWEAIGPFPTRFSARMPVREVKRALRAVYPPEREYRPGVSYEGAGGGRVSWKRRLIKADSVNFAIVCGERDTGVCYARTIVRSPRAGRFHILLGCDWWANLYVNGRLVKSRRDPRETAREGAAFNGWKPILAEISLRRGENVLLVKCHPGTTNNWMTFYINNPGDFEIRS